MKVEGGKWKVYERFGDCQNDLNSGLRPHLIKSAKGRFAPELSTIHFQLSTKQSSF